MWYIFGGLFFVTCICTANPAANRRIYSTVLNQKKWVKHLENPCRAPIDSQTNQTRLTMEGRQAEIRIMAGNMKSRLGLIKSHLMTSQCPMDLDSLSSVAGQPLINGSNLNIQIIYKSALLSSAHFRYMAEDWTAGQSCLTTEQDVEMRQAFESQADFYEVLMCKLMTTTSEDPSTIPRPSNQMVQGLYNEVLATQLYHFQDCSGRAMRDCRVFRTTQHFLQTLYNAATIATNLV